jgi:TPR repeat protein
MPNRSKREKQILSRASDKADAGDWRGAIRLYRVLANSGDQWAQHGLAYVLDCQAEPPRRKEAIYWYKRAIRKGNAASAWNLALCYAELGKLRWQMHWLKVVARMDKEYAADDMADRADDLIDQSRMNEAMPFLEVAAKLGCTRAQNNLAIILETKISPPHVRDALSLYKKAVKGGSKDAASNLALHYRDNNDRRQQRHWLRIAAQMGHSGSKRALRTLERKSRRG